MEGWLVLKGGSRWRDGEREGGKEAGREDVKSPERLQLGSQRSVQTVMLGRCEFKLRWDFPCQLMLPLSPWMKREWKQRMLRGEICHRRNDGGFPWWKLRIIWKHFNITFLISRKKKGRSSTATVMEKDWSEWFWDMLATVRIFKFQFPYYDKVKVLFQWKKNKYISSFVLFPFGQYCFVSSSGGSLCTCPNESEDEGKKNRR